MLIHPLPNSNVPQNKDVEGTEAFATDGVYCLRGQAKCGHPRMNSNKQSEKRSKEVKRNEVKTARKVGRRIDACGRYYQGELWA